MAGIKGQKWSITKPAKIKMNTSVDENTYEKLLKLRDKNRWSLASTISYVIEKFFEKK